MEHIIVLYGSGIYMLCINEILTIKVDSVTVNNISDTTVLRQLFMTFLIIIEYAQI